MARSKIALLAATTAVAALCAGLLVATPANAATTGATFYVAVGGSDSASGTTASAPFATLTRAQQAVRAVNTDKDVEVVVGDGTYELDEPLTFGVADGGQGDHSVTWRAAQGAKPVISGGHAVTNWTNPGGSGIWEAPLDSDFDFRQLYVDGAQATRSNAVVDANKFTWTRTGFSIDQAYVSSALGTTWSKLSALAAPDQRRIELRSRGSFTDRIAPFLSVSATSATMQQPSWDNNTWGWDTIDKPLPDNSHRTLRIQNALALIDQAGEWFFDITAKKLHYKPAAGIDPNTMKIIAPTQEALVSISGASADSKVSNLAFQGLSFQHSSYIQPNSSEGFANQQNGTFISGRIYALVDSQTRDLPTSDQRVFNGAEQAPSVRVIRLGDDQVYRYVDNAAPVNSADLPRLINMRDYPNLPLNSTQLSAWNAANPSAKKANCAIATYPSDCIGFESFRSFFQQSSAAVQVSAAKNVSFTGNSFAHIGGTALGIGNDSAASVSGVGLGAQDVSVINNSFSDIAATAVVAGGVETEAHHPSLAGNTNARVTISDNRIRDIGKDYFDVSGILVTYFDGAEVVHNELSQGPYDAIDSGWGWGVPDAGGNPAYQGRGAYLFSTRYANDNPTINRNIHIARNAMWDFKQQGSDGGILYNLGASPGSSWDSNHVMGDRGYKLYFDEGTRYMTAKNNVLSAGGTWTFANAFTDGAATPSNGQPNTTRDNTVDGTWVLGAGFNQGPWCYDSGACDPNGDGRWNNRITTKSQIGISEYPLEAQRVIAAAGIRPEYRRTGDRIGQQRGLELAISRDTSGAQILIATIVNLGSTPLSAIALTVTGSTSLTLSPVTPAPTTLAAGATGTATWRVAGGPDITDGTVSVSAAMTGAGTSGAARETVQRTLPVVLGGAVDSTLQVAGFGTYLAPQAVQSGASIALQSAGRDIGSAGDEYTTVYSRDGLSVNGSVTTKLDSVEGPFYRTGISVRNDLSRLADAAVAEKSTGYATLVAEPGWVAFRTDQNGDGVIDTQVDQASVSTRPLWLRIARNGNTLTASYSTNGVAYTELAGKAQLTGADAGGLDAGLVHSSASRTSTGATSALRTSTAVFSALQFASESRTPVIAPSRAPAGIVGRAYTYALSATHEPTFSVVAGALPDGLTLAGSGTISGTPTRAGTFSATVEARGEGGVATATVRITVRASAPASPDVSIRVQEPTVPGLKTGVGEISVHNPTADAAGYSVVVTDSAGAVLHRTDLVADAGADTLTRAERLAAGSYTVTVTGDDASAAVTIPLVILDGAFAALAAPWKSSQQGGANSQSLGVEGDQIAVVRQRSNDISGDNSTKTDSYSTVYKTDVLGVNDSVQVTMTGQERAGDFTKSGLIIRDDLSLSTVGASGASNGSGSSSGEAILVLTPTRGIRFSVENSGNNWYPTEIAATTAWNVAQSINTPVTLRLARQNGTTLVASYSVDGGSTFQVLSTRTGFFSAKPAAVLDAGVVQAANSGLAGTASTAAFRDFISGADTTAPAIAATAAAADVDGALNGAAKVVITNPTARDMFVDVSTTSVATGAVVSQTGAPVAAGGSASMVVPRLAAGDYLVSVRNRSTGAAATATVTIAAAQGLRIEPTVSSRCVAGKVTLVVSVRNVSDVPLTVTAATPYGSKTFTGLQPGKATSSAFTTRLVSTPAGTATIEATTPSGDRVSVPISYAAMSCR